MSSSRRHFITSLAALSGLSACGFTPVYGPNQAAGRLSNNIEVEVKDGRNAFEFRERLQNRFGRAAPDARYRLTYRLTITESDLVISSTEEITRLNLRGELRYQIIDLVTGKTVFLDRVQSDTAYSATSETFPTRVAERDANTRLVQSLAEKTVSRLAVTAEDWMA